MTHPSPSRSAAQLTFAASLPASGSVSAKAATNSPVAIRVTSSRSRGCPAIAVVEPLV